MGTNVSEALAAQGLDTSDLEANRAGRVSERQIARQAAVRRARPAPQRSGSRGVGVRMRRCALTPSFVAPTPIENAPGATLSPK